MEVVLKGANFFNHEAAKGWMHENRHLSVHLCTGYVVTLYMCRKYMRDRDPLKLNYLLIVWNLALAAFSVVGTVAIAPDFYAAWARQGFRESYCKAGRYFHGNNGYWVFLFTISKVVELGDSVFLVLRKRPLIFLHWYHHCTVLIYVWLAYPNNVAAVRWGLGMNFAVHSFMYTYYFVRSLRIKVPGWIPKTVTSMQIFQFLLGVFITADVTYRTYFGLDCECPFAIAAFQLGLYMSYLVLFANFFYHSYLKRGNTKIRVD